MSPGNANRVRRMKITCDAKSQQNRERRWLRYAKTSWTTNSSWKFGKYTPFCSDGTHYGWFLWFRDDRATSGSAKCNLIDTDVQTEISLAKDGIQKNKNRVLKTLFVPNECRTHDITRSLSRSRSATHVPAFAELSASERKTPQHASPWWRQLETGVRKKRKDV